MDDPPVIVGMACRLPGDKSAQGPVPPGRYNIEGFYHPQGGNRSGSTNVPGGYFINQDIREFDNRFFGINNLEATYMDPQQRKLLEVTYECLQSSGTTMEGISGSTTGVFVANFSVDYQPGQTRDPDYLHRYTATGSGATVMSNRISHVFNLGGPSFTVDTACSSSIFALHQALNAMKTGDCDSAIVASANLIMSPELHIGAAKSGVLSPTGTCHTFDISADGYGRAEGVNSIYVKRLSAALRDGNPIRAVIRGSAVNASGRTPGISLPSGKMQEVVMRKAYREAGLEFSDTDYVECHGTGTPVGDPIEVDAVGRCFARPQGPPLFIGSVKTNVGHSEGASGLTSILKVVMSFEKGKIAPVFGVKKLNPKLILDERNIKVVTKLEEWPRHLRRASINSFGYGGANGHVILESFESYLSTEPTCSKPTGAFLDGKHINGFSNGTPPDGTDTNGVHVNGNKTNGASATPDDYEQSLILPVSAASATSLQPLVDQILQGVEQAGDVNSVRNLAHTLSRGRDTLQHRSCILATYDGSSERYTAATMETPTAAGASHLPFAFVFTGQGAQYAGMAKELLLKSRLFRDSIRGLDEILRDLDDSYKPDWALEQTLLDAPSISRINEVTHSQPVCTAIQIGLVDLLRSWNIKPTSVVGHSSGEIAAAYAAGLLNARQAILVAYFRGYAVGQLRSKGAMMAAGLTPEEAKSLIEEKALQAEVRVACVNAPSSVTLSGSLDAIETLRAKLQGEQKFARKLVTGNRAYHSHMMEEIGALYEKLLVPLFTITTVDRERHLSEDAEKVEMYSSVGHSPLDLRLLNSKTMGAAYWRQNLEQPVQFSAALATLAEDVNGIQLIEIGPHSALKGPIQQIRKSIGLDEISLPYLPTLVRNEDASLQIKVLAGTLFKRGISLDLGIVNNPEGLMKWPEKPQMVHSLQPYPWDYSGDLLWSEPRASIEMRNRKHIRHELLGTIALTGNSLDYTWRNILKPSEMPWIEDHKLEDQVVFPAAGYVAMAIEAISQITNIKKKLQEGDRNLGFELRDVNIIAALNVPAENDKAGKDLELHTTMSLRKISGANTSADWHDFSISSLYWTSNQHTIHCTGSIRVTQSRKGVDRFSTTIKNADGFDLWASTAKWYSKWHEEGLCFGPQFQSLTTLRTDSARNRREAIATARVSPLLVGGTYEHYPVHPITIDAGLQAACLSGTSGHVAALKTWLPVYIAEAHIQPSLHPVLDSEGEIHVKSEEMGFSSRRIDGTIRDASGSLVFEFKDSRIALYNGKNAIAAIQHAEESGTDNSDGGGLVDPLRVYLQRQPTLRIQWKPDVLRLGSRSREQLLQYLADFFEQQHPDVRDDESLAVIGGLLELVGHKNPSMRVLEIGSDSHGYKAKLWQTMLGSHTAFSRVRGWHAGRIEESGHIVVEDDADSPFDVVLIPSHAAASNMSLLFGNEEAISSLVRDHGVVITRKSDVAMSFLEKAGFDVLDLRNQVVLAVRRVKDRALQGRNTFIVKADHHSSSISKFADSLSVYLREEAGANEVNIVDLNLLESIEIKETDVCISLLEAEHEFLPIMSPIDMDRLRMITDKANDLLWVTGANMLGDDPNPNLTLSNGLSRALMLEQPTLRWSVLDAGKQLADQTSATNLSEDIVKTLIARIDRDDCEFISVNGLLHVSRYSPDFGVNSLFRRRMEPQTAKLEKQTLAEADPARLTIGRPGVTDTMHFQQLCEPGGDEGPHAGYVDIKVKSVSLNAKDVYAMSGRVETRNKTTAFDFSGVVSAVGPGSTLKIGDRVVAYAPFHIGTTARVPVGCVHPLLDHEDFNLVPTLLVAYATALYALNDRAHLRKGESVLIHAGSGGFGVAAITLAQKMGATVYTTCGSQGKRDYLTNELGVPSSHIFSSRDSSFVQGIAEATNGRGVDVIVNSLVGDLMHDSWERCVADFGRFVEVGKRELINAGRLNMRAFLRNVTFTAFDLSELFYAQDPFHRAIWDRLMVETLDLYRAGDIAPPPMKVFDITQVSQAYRYFGNKDRVGKVVISMENANARVPVAPATYMGTFDPEKVYLLIGCLGGLGRSLSRWMMTRGARNFVFLGRSGADKPSAKQLVTRLEENGATVGVVRGDVSQAADVKAAVAQCVSMGRKVGGVVQAAMGLHEALFTRMPNEAWHTGIDPKYQGTWNLHNALDGHDLDFFLLTSSVSGTVGTATESNYCSANGFLDAFARWRRSRGLPCVSVGLGMISEVGYLHENPEIEALLLRKGIQPLNEDEFLQVVDLALSSEAGRDVNESHMLTGLEPAAVRELSARGFDVMTHGVLVEARSSVLLASLQAEQEVVRAASADAQGASAAMTKTAAPWFKDVPAALTASFAPEANADTMQEAILRLMKKRFSNLILLPVEQVDERKALPEFGVDSMVASEFRSWFYAVFKVDVPFLDIMSPQKSLLVLAESVEGKLLLEADK
ncbi:polyketide synthase [Xylariaceae sp. FL0016]|nr:polyketide synthase [Xylariaceae sp. FL0016]